MTTTANIETIAANINKLASFVNGLFERGAFGVYYDGANLVEKYITDSRIMLHCIIDSDFAEAENSRCYLIRHSGCTFELTVYRNMSFSFDEVD